MKLVNRISAAAILVFLSIGGASALILVHGCADIRMLFTPGQWFKDLHTAIPFVTLAVLLFGAVVLLLWMQYFARHVVKVMRRSEDFIREILAGNMPGRLSTEGIKDDEIVSLFSTLNFMRDRQVNLAERLRQQRESEEKLRQEIEFYDELQLAAFGILLPEMRRSAGVIKAYTLTELARARKENRDDPESWTMLPSLRRLSSLSRELSFLSDVAKLERKRWSDPLTDRISTLELIRELKERCQLSLNSREILFVCEYRAGTPKYISSDRELLYQQLYLLINSVARSLMGGSQVTLSVSGRGRNAVFEISDRAADPHRESLTENYRACFLNSSGKPDISTCSLSTIGLELVRTVSDKLGSLFEADSTEEMPSVLRMTVPAAAAGGNTVPESPLLMHKASLPAPAPRELASGSLNILISDDDPEEAQAFARLFAYEDIHLDICSNSTGIAEKISGGKTVDGIVIASAVRRDDLQKLIDRLRRLAKNPELPILIITPVHKRELAQELAAVPAVWCLETPLNFAQAANLLRGKTA